MPYRKPMTAEQKRRQAEYMRAYHKRRRNSRKYPFTCPYCEREGIPSGEAEDHMKQHEDEDPEFFRQIDELLAQSSKMRRIPG